MKIKYIKIKNYRNLNGLEVYLHDTINFIVGENNLGKSNFLNLLNILFSKRNGFEKEDFLDKDNPIEIEFTLKLEDCEKGNFEDLIDVENLNQIRIKAVQENFEESLKFEHLDSGEKIMLTKIRNINYVHYDSLRNPITEISFDKVRGAGNFLNHLIKKKMKGSSLKDRDLIKFDNQDFTNLLSEVNTTLQKIKSFKDHSITAKFETEIENLLTKLVLLKDTNERGLDKIGYGVQFSMLIALSILEKLVLIYQNKYFQAFDYEQSNSEEIEKKKAISLVLGLDEPEIHLHPYMQRALVKYLVNITESKDTDFLAILKEVFDFDKVIGQVIIVTHSPNIVLNDYKQIIRFSQENALKVYSGNVLSLNSQLEKHLLIRFELIKEVFFSRCVILVEGDLEMASFPLFAKTMGINFDDSGVSVINVSGRNDIPHVMELLNKFGIKNTGIQDKDDGRNLPTIPHLFVTNKRDFEDEIVSILESNVDNEQYIINTILEHSSSDEERFVKAKDAIKIANKYGIPTIFSMTENKCVSCGKSDKIPPSDKLEYSAYQSFDLNTKKIYLLGLLTASRFKSYLTGRTIGEKFTEELIPQIYKDVISKAVQLANNQ